MKIEPFRVHIDQSVLEDLRQRLARTRWPDAIPAAEWDYGFSLAYLKELAAHWRERFDWRVQESEMNRFAHFRATVDGVGLHFLHERGRGPNPLPLVITHGWPGSLLEMLKILPLLTDPAAHGGAAHDSFDVIVPSIPGFGFSDRPTAPGMNTFRVADLWLGLMDALGYRRFGLQGGDFGANISSRLAFLHPDRVVGLHLNYIPGSYRPHLGAGTPPLSKAEQQFRQDDDCWYESEGAYAHVQLTRPQTLAYGLNDSPAALAAWIVEMFRLWADCGGDVESRFSKDELLANVTLYWVTETIHSSCRLYLESSKRPLHFGPGERISVPVGIARFPLEAPFPPREWVERVYNVTRWAEMARGGHFAALEEPALLAEDLRAFFRPLR